MYNHQPAPINNTNSWLIRIGGFVMSVAIMISSWLLKEAWDSINKNEQDIQALRVDIAAATGSKFTNNDWVIQKALIDSEKLSLDRRVMRLEESLPSIKESLLKIEKLMDK